MGLIAALVFIAAYSRSSRCRSLSRKRPPAQSKQALATLDSALKTESQSHLREQNLNLRKDEQLSSIPWLNKKLLKLDIAALFAQDAEPGRL